IFRKRKDLTRQNVDVYFREYPTEIAAFDRYIKGLVFQSYIPVERADALLVVASQYKSKQQLVTDKYDVSSKFSFPSPIQ
ncbi:hypothetical protein OAM79_03785, partial [Litorivicinus sp.]|nr:hypothetical protein [Litorivicinus sp.]